MTKRINTSFATMMLALTVSISAMADVVYEPLIVDSGFNRDCIAERYPINSSIAKTYLNFDNSTTYCFATKSVIDSVNTHNGLFANNPTDFAIAKESGWPDNYQDTIKCILDAKDNDLYKDVFWLLAPYDQSNVLTLRPNDEKRNYCQSEGTLKFKKVGCYSKLFFLTVSAREGGVSEDRKVTATIHYTDGFSEQKVFSLATGFGGEDNHKVCMTNTFEGYFNKNTGTQGKACASVFDMDVDKTKLIHRIEFSNTVKHSVAIILAVTGRTADMPIPAEEAATVSNIDANSFEACWEAVADAASYRLDVAEDPDFQRILEAYNNKEITGSTCQEVAGLIAANDYYWRVRSVNADGGQSASSAPKRVKTEAAEGPQEEDETSMTIQTDMTALLNTTTNITINRTLYKDGCFNTLCLPFSLDEAGIAASPLAGCELFVFDHASKVGDGQLEITMTPTYVIEAGVPYLIKWQNTGQTIDHLLFNSVTITTDHGQAVGGEGNIQFVGNVGRYQMAYEDHDNLFVGAANKLYWPNTTNPLKGFRAYFAVPHSGENSVQSNTPARIVVQEEVATGMNVQGDNVQCTKVLHDGQVYIFRDGKWFNVLGMEVEQ